MKRHIAQHVLIAKLAALALSVLCFLQAPVRAQGMNGCIVIFPSVGFAPGQSLRFTLFNPDGEPRGRNAGVLRAGRNRRERATRNIRWVAERTFSWLSKCRGLLSRYEKKSKNYLGLLQFACALYWYRRLRAATAGSS
jgi:hypothetical protein